MCQLDSSCLRQSQTDSLLSLFMRHGAWALPTLFVGYLTVPARGAKCSVAYIAVKAIRPIHLALLAVKMAFFWSDRTSNRLAVSEEHCSN